MTIHPIKRIGAWAVVVPFGTIYFVLVCIGCQTVGEELRESGIVSQYWAEFIGKLGFIAGFLSFMYPFFLIDWIWGQKAADGSGSDPGKELPGH